MSTKGDPIEFDEGDEKRPKPKRSRKVKRTKPKRK
jgi:hypothetical protein